MTPVAVLGIPVDANSSVHQNPTVVHIDAHPDLDGLDPSAAPGVSHHEPGGLTVRELLDLIDALPRTLVGADVVELIPSRDVVDMTAMVGAKLVKEIVGAVLDGSNGSGA